MRKFPSIMMSVLFLLLAGCASYGPARGSDDARAVLGMLERGDAEALRAAAGSPFLFETEVLPSPAQAAALFEALGGSGFSFAPAAEPVILPVDDRTREMFSSSADARVFFARDLPPGALWASVPVEDGRLILLLGRARRVPGYFWGLKVENE